jgi:hypothetical protein
VLISGATVIAISRVSEVPSIIPTETFLKLSGRASRLPVMLPLLVFQCG